MAEHDADREPDERDALPEGEQQGPSFDEAAAWDAIVAGYGDEPPDPPGAKPFKSVEDLALLEPETNDAGGGSGSGDSDTKTAGTSKGAKGAKGQKGGTGHKGGTDATDPEAEADDKPATEAEKPLGSSVAFAPGVAGPRDYAAPEPAEEDFDEDDEGHFVPPEPPPLPTGDATARFAWLGVIGGPLLLLLAVLLGWEMTWWLTTLGIGGFLGGFVTLVARMRGDEEDEDDPGRGAVV
ncbi:hypothetical protein ACFFS2_06580 [Streptomyces aurantiacus]|uniref:DUF308 domain-containing protein n=1 Tax=Streptomyces aurantiacus TaxID=47760 RepID=A0A7G1PDR7_9ACTN|nr:hypothetical protein [Streptomyces aurantiacus]BCL31215.1 hypothetical protein GCM10017557_60740 [Streptomyces aurantiacus]